MTCAEAKKQLTSSRLWGHGATDNTSPELAEHLSHCGKCQQFRDMESHLDQRIQATMMQVAIPATGQREALWALRQARRQQQRARTLYWSLAAAAVLLVGVSVNWYVKRPYDLARLHETVSMIDQGRIIATFHADQGNQPAELKQWLSRQGLPLDIPSRLRLQFLSAAYIIEAGGRKVPVLEMRVGSSTSRVCLLQRRYFNEHLQRQLFEHDQLVSFVIADHDLSEALGWMIVDQGNAHLFVDGMVPQNGV